MRDAIGGAVAVSRDDRCKSDKLYRIALRYRARLRGFGSE